MSGPSFFMFASEEETFKHRYCNVLVQHETDEGCDSVMSKNKHSDSTFGSILCDI